MGASAGQTEDKNGSNPTASRGGLPQVSQMEYRGVPQFGSTLRFSHQRESHLESGGEDPEVLNDGDHAFLLIHIRKGIRGTYNTGRHWFYSFCKGHKVNAELAH